jgi:DMSO/TMAO reductase YedYZ molybdopterin-dependent catalytic subunit
MTRWRFEVPLFSRRDALRLGGLGAVGAVVGCESLDLPEVRLIDAWPPVSDTRDFYVQGAFGTPEDLDPETVTLEILDRGVAIGTLTPEAVRALVPRELEYTLQCIGATPRGLLINNAIWGGLPFTEVLEQLEIPVPADALEMVFRCADGYHTSIPATDLHGLSEETDTDEPIWLMWRMNGEPLNLDHGAPFRFLTPGRYGTKNPKWPESLDFVDTAHTGYWEDRGWSNEATYKTNTFVLAPPTMSVVGEGIVRILGSAFAGARQIESVEITTDGGSTWIAADIQYQPGGHIWTLWAYDWTLDGPGTYEIQARARDVLGGESTLEPDGTDRKSGFDGGMVVELTVT